MILRPMAHLSSTGRTVGNFNYGIHSSFSAEGHYILESSYPSKYMPTNNIDNSIAKTYGNRILPCIKASFGKILKMIKIIIKPKKNSAAIKDEAITPNACAMIGLTTKFKKTMNIAINIEIKRTMYFI